VTPRESLVELAWHASPGLIAMTESGRAMPPAPDRQLAARLIQAERTGLRLALICRTLALAAGAAWYFGAYTLSDRTPNPGTIIALTALILVGAAYIAIIGTRLDQPWMKYLIYTADILGICAGFVLIPVSHGEDVPQIIAFRSYGIYFLFPLVAMAALSLSWGLVLWCGLVGVAGWWAAFFKIIEPMERTLTWGDLPDGPTRADYETIFLSIDFIGIGNRVEESGTLLITACILALAVYRARTVFFAQVSAEAARESERAARERITQRLGRFVPEAIAQRLIADDSALAPQRRLGAVLVADVANFTAFSAAQPPETVIATLNSLLASCADVVADAGGVVISFTGDGLLATFNTPIEMTAPETAALQAALDIHAIALKAGFSMRVGLAAGPIAAGSVGSAKRQAFTVYGDTVNRAARLEQLGKELGETLLIDRGIASALPFGAKLHELGAHQLRGLEAPVEVWTLTRTSA
jgi:adenylate cyclase